jgi:hypothetical protein
MATSTSVAMAPAAGPASTSVRSVWTPTVAAVAREERPERLRRAAGIAAGGHVEWRVRFAPVGHTDCSAETRKKPGYSDAFARREPGHL